MPEPVTKRSGLIPVGFWLVYALTRLGTALRGASPVAGNDDLARLVQVRQWMAGQSWFDLTQYRLNPPTGVAMHWTRHSDALVAGLIYVAGGPGSSSERFAVIALPILLSLALYVLVAAIARQVGGRSAIPAALLLLLASVLAAVQFAPGRIDHHGLQIVVLLLAVLGLLRFEEPRWALLAGVSAGVSLSIGLEQLLTVAGVIVVVGVIGARRLDVDRSLRVFAGGLGGAALASALLFAPAARLSGISCDVFSLPHLIAISATSLTLAVLPRSRRPITTLLAGGAAAAVGFLLVAPRCIDPYADVDPVLRRLWLSNVAEAQGIGSMLRDDPSFGWAILVPGLLALTFALWMWKRGSWGTGPWFRLTVVMAIGYSGAAVQFRGAAAATALSVPVLGVMFVRIRARLEHWPMLGRIGVMVAVVLMISGLGPLLVGVAGEGSNPSTTGEVEDCDVAMGALASLDGLVLAPIDLGPDLLIGTDAGVLAAPYHRNNEGNRMAWDLFMGPTDEADFAGHGIDWVVTCEGMLENGLLAHEAPDGLLADLLEGEVPATLEVTDLGGDGLVVYRVKG